LAIYATPEFAGVAVIVAVTGLVPAFTAVNEAILPLPLAASPTPGVSLVQVKRLAVPVKLTAAVALVFTTVWLAIVFAVGSAFIVAVTATF